VLIQLCFIILMLFGVAALTVDLGIARLTQIQMQNAADTAALEGLRGRDALGDPQRRFAACEMAAWNFDDAFNPHCQPGETDFEALGSTPEGAAWLGTGPVLTLDGGATPLNAEQTLNLSTSGVYKPVLQSNLANDVNGDMVSGTFGASSPNFGTDPGCTVTNPNQYPEDCDYNRADFTAATGGSEPSFLVRLRRTDGRSPLDRDSNVASSGPSLPFLFGRALPMHAGPNSAYDPRVHGMTVRATAISNLAPALQAGPPHPELNPPLPGWAPLAIRASLWSSSLIDGGGLPATFFLSNAGVSSTLVFDGTSTVVGQSLQQPAPPQGAIRTGDSILPLESALPPAVPECGAVPPPNDACGIPAGSSGYLPIYDDTSNVVVGFGFINICRIHGGPLQITPMNGHVACANAAGSGGGAASQLGISTSLLVPVIAR